MDLLKKIDNLVWGPPLLILLLVVGLYLTWRLNAVQFRYLGYALKIAFSPWHQEKESKKIKGISPFQSLMTGLAATIGIGNIAGVAVALVAGGIGSLFWMWVIALLGMSIRYAECVLAVKYRNINVAGQVVGGPMYYIEKGLRWKWLAAAFAIFGSIAAMGTGNMVQVNAVTQSLMSFPAFQSVGAITIGFALTGITAVLLAGGIKRIGQVSAILVPIMATMYFFGGVFILLMNYQHIPNAFINIFYAAFHGQAAFGGFMGATAMVAIQQGVSRGIFSNESGLGSAPIAAAAASTNSPVKQALISMTGSFIATLIICTITGLVITVTGSLGAVDSQGQVLNGIALTMEAFKAIPGGQLIVTIGTILFAYSTLLGWAYYGEKCFEYLFGVKSASYYRWGYILTTIPAAVCQLDLIWLVANIANALMAFPNLIAVIFLSGVVAQETKQFVLQKKQGTLPDEESLELPEETKESAKVTA